jgi:hypothetical protein
MYSVQHSSSLKNEQDTYRLELDEERRAKMIVGVPVYVHEDLAAAETPSKEESARAIFPALFGLGFIFM